MSPVEMVLPSPCCFHFNEISNDELKGCELSFLEEMRDESQAKLVVYQRKMTRYDNSEV